MVQGRTYTSNTTKLLKHMDVLQGMQNGKISPIMLLLAPTNKCNINCSFCCYANRDRKEELSFDQIKIALDSFRSLGTKSLEMTGGGSSELHPMINKILDYAHEIGYKIGICTNGKDLTTINDWGIFEWVRLNLCFDQQNYKIDMDYLKKFDTKICGSYVFEKTGNKETDLENIQKIIDFSNREKIPTRFAVDVIQEKEGIEEDYNFIKDNMSDNSKYCFVSDFNIKTKRKNNHCYMHLIKPFIFPDGWVYSCTTIGYSVENNLNVSNEARLCKIEDIISYYGEIEADYNKRNCSFCKFTKQNELIEDILAETEHNDFV